MDRNVWIYGTGLLVIVGGCFAIGYSILPTKPAFGTKQVKVTPIVGNTPEPTPQATTEPQVPKLVIEDITAEKAATEKPTNEPAPTSPEPDSSSPEELDIKVDTAEKQDTPERDVDTSKIESAPSAQGTEPVNAVKPSRPPKQPIEKNPIKSEARSDAGSPIDDSVTLFRVRIASIQTSRKEANALVGELKDKGFSATVLPLAGSFVVQAGAFKDRKSAEALQKTLIDNGYDTSISN